MLLDAPLIFLVDDDPLVRSSLRRILKRSGYLSEAFATADEFLKRGAHEGPACLLLDVHMPDVGGLELQRALLQIEPLLPIIFVTGQGDIPTTVEAMKTGAIDFLQKPVSEEALLKAIELALQQSHLHRRQHSERAQITQRLESLTPRQREVLDGVIAGHPNKQIAADLGTVEQTVKLHRGRIMRKMGVTSLADLVRNVESVRASRS